MFRHFSPLLFDIFYIIVYLIKDLVVRKKFKIIYAKNSFYNFEYKRKYVKERMTTMAKTRNYVISIILVLAMIFSISITAFAADAPSGNFHKVNGTYVDDGGPTIYTTTITKACEAITVWGESVPKGLTVEVVVSNPNKVVASKNVTLDGTEVRLEDLITEAYLPGTYTVTVTPINVGTLKPYEISTYFYVSEDDIP